MAALGHGYWNDVPPKFRDVRPAAMIVREFVTGLRPAPVQITRGVPFGEAGEFL